MVRILWIDPIGSDTFEAQTLEMLNQAKQPQTQVEFVSLPGDRPQHLEYHAYDAFVIPDIVRITHRAAGDYDAVVIGCFYDVGLREAREVSGRTVVMAPCQTSTDIASHLGNSFSVLVGRRKWVPKMKENIRLYGHDHALVSMRSLELSVYDFQSDPIRTADALMQEGRKAIEEDGAEVLILGCTANYGFHEKMQQALGVPVIDSVLAPFKYAEFLAESAQRFGWVPSRVWGSEAPPVSETEQWKLFDQPTPIGNKPKSK